MSDVTEQSSLDVGWGNAPSLQDLKDNLEMARSPHDAQVGKVRDWLSLLHTDSKNGDKQTGRSNIQPKTIRRNNEWRYTSLSEAFLNTPDIYKVRPRTALDLKAAKQNQLVLNYQFNTCIDKVTYIDRYVRKCVDEGTVIVRVGWESSLETRKVRYPEYELMITEDPTKIAELDKAAKANPTSLPIEITEALLMTADTGMYYYPVQVGWSEEEVEEFTVNRPTIEVCDQENFIPDPSCNGDLDKAQFAIYSFETSMSELEKAGIYKNLENIDPDSSSVIADGNHSSNWSGSGFKFSDKARKKMVAYEYWGYWDIDGSGITKPIVATWIGNTMIRLELSEHPDGKLPFVVVPYLPVDGSLFGEPDGELIKDNQQVIGAVMRGMIDLMGRSANGQTGIRKGALDPINRKKFDAGMDYEFNDFGDGQQSIHQHTYPEVPMSVYNMISMQNQEAESLSGVKAFSQGITGAGLGDTATHAQGALDAAARRELGILRRLANGMQKVARKIIALNQTFLSEEEVIRITDENFTVVHRDDLAGHFDLELDISTAESDEQKAQELAFMLQTTGQQFGLGMYKMILSEIATLRKMPHLAAMIKEYEPEPDPMQELELQDKQLELRKKQAEIMEIEAKAQKALAEAGNRQADTDKKNLDYIEQEMGVSHARELEKDQAQAQGNMKLEAFRNALQQSNQSQENPQ